MPLTVPRRPVPVMPLLPSAVGQVWYVAFGSNMHRARLEYYLAGGRPPGGARTYPGCRDARRPERSVPVVLPGSLYFAGESPAWTGGMGFYDPEAPGELWGRAYLVTAGQFSDIAAQEMLWAPDRDLDLAEVLAHGRARLGSTRYGRLVCAGALDGVPALTCTAPGGMGDLALNRPSARYLAYIAGGLAEAGGWEAGEITAYLAGRPGAAGAWSPDEIAALVL
ncbi:MAG: histone deacetylase [Streptomyces oryziradicis]|jgi:hypothetical protein|nr:histone deacetylase [Actinacidiphila oryziradicis]